MLMPLKIPLLSGNVSVLIIYFFFSQRMGLMPTFIVLVNFQLLEESLKAKQSKKQICRNSYGTNELRTRRVYRILSHSFTLLLKNIFFLLYSIPGLCSIFARKSFFYIKINIECFEVNIKAGVVVVLIIQIFFYLKKILKINLVKIINHFWLKPVKS